MKVGDHNIKNQMVTKMIDIIKYCDYQTKIRNYHLK